MKNANIRSRLTTTGLEDPLTKMDAEEVINDVLTGFIEAGYLIRLKGKMFPIKGDIQSIRDLSSHATFDTHTAVIFLYSGNRFFKKYEGSFKIRTERRTRKILKSTMFIGWSSYKLLNIAAKINHNEVRGWDLR